MRHHMTWFAFWDHPALTGNFRRQPCSVWSPIEPFLWHSFASLAGSLGIFAGRASSRQDHAHLSCCCHCCFCASLARSSPLGWRTQLGWGPGASMGWAKISFHIYGSPVSVARSSYWTEQLGIFAAGLPHFLSRLSFRYSPTNFKQAEAFAAKAWLSASNRSDSFMQVRWNRRERCRKRSCCHQGTCPDWIAFLSVGALTTWTDLRSKSHSQEGRSNFDCTFAQDCLHASSIRSLCYWSY